MPLALFLPLVSLAIYLVPIWLLRRKAYPRTQDYFVSCERTPPSVIRNSSIAYALKMATFGPFFTWGANGDLWPAIINSISFPLGACLIYVLRRPMLEFLESALGEDRSITVHDFIARRHGNDQRVRLLASFLTLFAILALIVGEALVLATFLKPLLSGSVVSTSLCVAGTVALAGLYAVLSGHSGVMRSAQSQLGMSYFGLFAATALLLYLLVSALRPATPHTTLAIAFVAVCCAAVPLYRRSRYVDTGRIGSAASGSGSELGTEPMGARLFRRFEKIMNPCISVFAAWVVVLSLMELSSDGLAAVARDSAAALGAGTRLATIGLVALFLLPLVHPMVDVTNWQRMAVFAKDSALEPGHRGAALRGFIGIYAAEIPLMSLFMCTFGAIAVASIGTAVGPEALPSFMGELAAEQNVFTAAAVSLLLVGVLAIALSTIGSLFSASLCTVRYDVLQTFSLRLGSVRAESAEQEPRASTVAAAAVYLAIIIAGILLAEAYLDVSYTSSAFLALLFACSCAQISFVPLVLGPLIGRTSETVSPGWALLILGLGATVGLVALALYATTGSEPWLWAAVPSCLASGLLLLAIARLRSAMPSTAA